MYNTNAVIIFVVIVILAYILHLNFKKESLINYNYINEIELETDLINKDNPIKNDMVESIDSVNRASTDNTVSTGEVDSYEKTFSNNDFVYNALTYDDLIKNSIKEAMLDDNTVDSNNVLRSANVGKRMKRMFDAKNSLVKLDWIKYFYTEEKDNEKVPWWEEHKDVMDPMSY